MAVTYGFYNSINKDRAYNAIQMGQIFDGIINDGIYMSVLNHFAVRAGGGMNVIVGGGRAWFNHTWTYNDSDLIVKIDDSEFEANRIDAIVIKIDRRDVGRENSITVIKGTPSENPVKPTIEDGGDIYYHPLAYITVNHGVTSIIDADIENVIGIDERTKFVTGIIETISIESFIEQWRSEFEQWFDHLQDELDTNQAAHLQHEIDDLTEREFNHYYDLCTRSTHYNRDINGDITGWTSTGDGYDLTVTITEEEGSKTMVYVISDGTMQWTKTSVFDGTDLVETFSKEAVV